jgi:hypothetical protein
MEPLLVQALARAAANPSSSPACEDSLIILAASHYSKSYSSSKAAVCRCCRRAEPQGRASKSLGRGLRCAA